MTGISPNTYETTAIDDTAIITPSEVGDWLNLSAGMVTLKSDLITRLINTAISQASNYAWIDLQRTTRIAYYDLSPSGFFSFVDGTLKLTLERSPILALTDITKIEHLDTDGTWTEFSRGTVSAEGIYENVTEKKEQRGWASVYFKEAIEFDASRINAYKVRITFTSGYTIATDPVTDIPEALKQAILMIVAYYFTNRGDCSDAGCSINGYPVPCPAKQIIDMYAVSRTVLGGSYNPMGLC